MEYAKNGSIPQSAQTAGPIIVKLVGNPEKQFYYRESLKANLGQFNLRTPAGDLVKDGKLNKGHRV